MKGDGACGQYTENGSATGEKVVVIHNKLHLSTDLSTHRPEKAAMMAVMETQPPGRYAGQTRGIKMANRRPDMRNYFRAKIDYHVNGMASMPARLPPGVRSIEGDVTSSRIVVTDTDGKRWEWSGGRYASRKVNGCYAPLMPRPLEEADKDTTP